MPGLVGDVSLNGEQVSLDLMQAMCNATQDHVWYKADDYVNCKERTAIQCAHQSSHNG